MSTKSDTLVSSYYCYFLTVNMLLTAVGSNAAYVSVDGRSDRARCWLRFKLICFPNISVSDENKHQQNQRFISVRISIIYQVIRMIFSLASATREYYWFMLEAANLLICCINFVVK